MVAVVEFVITVWPPGLGATPWACRRVEKQAVTASASKKVPPRVKLE
jgi:hypothetical protein